MLFVVQSIDRSLGIKVNPHIYHGCIYFMVNIAYELIFTRHPFACSAYIPGGDLIPGNFEFKWRLHLEEL